MPHSRPMPQIDTRCHELRIRDAGTSWRVIYSIEPDAVVVLAVFSKKDQQTPEPIRKRVRQLLRKWRR